MKTIMAILAALTLALSLAGCSTAPGVDPKLAAQQRVNNITIAYSVVRSAATLCVVGAVCRDEGVREAVAAGLVTADLAVAEATRLILASATDQSAVAKYAGIALAAIDVLAKALQAYGVRVAPA